MGAQKIEVLQAGRGVAALAVVAYHANIFLPTHSAFTYGNLGVPFFFCLSGYLMVHIHVGRFDVAKFMWARIARIYPAYLPISVASAVAYAAIGRDFNWLATLTLLPGKPALLVAWTLQREIFFYVLIGFAIWCRFPIKALASWAICIVARLMMPLPMNAFEAVTLDPYNLLFVAGAFVRVAGFIPQVRCPTFLLHLGDASYSIYLVHLPLMGGLWRLGANFSELVLVSILGGFCYWRLFEKPLAVWLTWRWRQSPPKSQASHQLCTTSQSTRPASAHR